MRVSNEREEQVASQFADLLRLQTDFQTRMTEETLRYLRAVQAALAPVVPTTVVTAAADEEVTAAGAPGERVELSLEVENTQKAHVTATAALTPMVERRGTTWFPIAEPSPPLLLLPPGETAELRVGVTLPTELAPGEYRGALLLQGFRHDGLPVVITVGEAPTAGPARARKSTAKKAARKKSTGKKSAGKKAAGKKTSTKKATAKKATSS